MDHATLIKLLGGPSPISAALGCHRTRVCRWRTQGIPPARYPSVVKLARKVGLAGVTLEALHAGRALTERRAVRQAARAAA